MQKLAEGLEKITEVLVEVLAKISGSYRISD
jgi:hypothetical protein